MKAVIDWLNGRVHGYTTVDGDTPVAATWDSGKNAMIGKSYDGTLANGVAATGVDGPDDDRPALRDLRLVPLLADRTASVSTPPTTRRPCRARSRTTRPATLGVVPPDRNVPCAASRTQMSADDGDATGDVNAFWQARDYHPNVGNVHASVFASHGLNDDNVKLDHLTAWWAGLAAHNVPRKLWLSQEGHIDPFDYRRDGWVDTLHRWFDLWLLGVQNGIMSEPRVTIERRRTSGTRTPTGRCRAPRASTST